MTDRELMQQALEALETCSEDEWYNDDDFGMMQVYDEEKIKESIAALRERLAQPEQEPVAWYDSKTGWTDFYAFKPVRQPSAPDAEWLPLYTAPPQRKLLTPREVELLDGMIEVQLRHAAQCDGIANRTMAEKQKSWDMERVELLRKLKSAHGIKGDA